MKNLYKVASKRKFRGIIFKTETTSAKVESETTEFDETAENVLSRFGLSPQDVKDVWALLFGGIDDLFKLLDRETDFNKTASGGDENPAKNDKAGQNNAPPETGPLLKGTIDGLTAYNMLNPLIGITSSKYPVVKPPFLPRNTEGTTSLHGIRRKTIEGINFLQEQLDIPLLITGGTETFCHSRKGGHHQGYKLDISFDSKKGSRQHDVEKKMMEYINSKKVKSEVRTVNSGKFKGRYESWEINDGGYKMIITKETGVPGGDHYDIAFA
jgi:hypothetical protein